MGFDKNRRPMGLQGLTIGPRTIANLTTAMGGANLDLTIPAATNGVQTGRVVRVKASGVCVPTTGSSGRAGIGITMASGSSGQNVRVRVFGVVNAVASTAAIAWGSHLRGASGASTGNNAGTVKTTTGIAQSCIGIALSTLAAGAIANTRTVKVLILHNGQILA